MMFMSSLALRWWGQVIASKNEEEAIIKKK
jgi:hypothetical protein